jgi:hypothetical protein
MLIRFFTRKDFGGWRSLVWLPVQWMQGKYVHCEVEVQNVILNASNVSGIEVKSPLGPIPSEYIFVEHDAGLYHAEANRLLGQKYSWGAFFGLLLPRWGNDPKGMICSELVAHMIAISAKDERFQIPFIATPPYRWTPNAIHRALTRLCHYVEN